MKLPLLAVASTTLGIAVAANVEGFDISNWQPDVDFEEAYESGARFVISKTTEGTYYTSPSFSRHEDGARDAGLIFGAYHFAIPPDTTGAEQAKFFIKNGGGWTEGTNTLPGMLDFEKPPDHPNCFDMTPSELVSWAKDFSSTYFKETGRYPIVYTSAPWWEDCMGDSDELVKTHPLMLAQWEEEIHRVPGSWGNPMIWQKDAKYEHGGDSNEFLGTMKELKKFANGRLLFQLRDD